MTYTATYSPEDNKLRLYSSTHLDRERFPTIIAVESEISLIVFRANL